jgi:tetratricopeptide (TPR) repeat protein
MAKGVLKDIKQPPSLWQRLLGGFKAARLTKAESPALTPDAVTYYYAALVGKTPQPGLARVARALLWADIKARQFHSLCKDWYPLAAEAFPDDERCAFYVAALYYHGFLTPESSQLEKVLGGLMKVAWRDSGYWSKLDLPRTELLKRLTDAIAGDEIRITPERLPVLEAAFDATSLTEEQRITTARWLGVAYRASGRSDDRAEIVYRYLFLNVADDDENNEYLANLFAGRGLDDANACAVYSRMVTIADKRGDQSSKAQWSLKLSNTYIAQNRLGAEAIMPLQAALSVRPGDRLLEAALAYSVGRSDLVLLEPSLIKHMETAIAFESEFVPHFTERQWQWSVVPRALALAWGRSGRRDSLALFIYARACELCPEEKVIWNYYATALVEAKDYSRKVIPIYERAHQANKDDNELTLALATAYQENRFHDGPDRRKAMVLWENLYRQGSVTLEILSALTEAYLREERLSDTALELLQKMSRQGSTVPGPLLLRVAQEWKSRGDLTTALRWYQEAEHAMPDHFLTLLEYGLLLKEQFSDFTGAVNVLARAVILPVGAKNLEAHLALAESLLALDKREDARRIFQIIIERIDPNHTQTLLHLARLNLKFEEKGMLRAETYYERAANVEPDNPETYLQMVELYRAQGNTKMEQWALEQYLKLGPGDSQSYRALANLYIRRGEFDKAESALRQVIALGQADRDVYTLLGDVIQQARRAV